MSEERIPCIPGLFSENDGVAQIHGSRCASCRTPYFPKSAACHNPDCGESKMEDCSFSGSGVLWSYSVANFPPPAPHKFDKPFTPYAVGVADLDCGRLLYTSGAAGEGSRGDLGWSPQLKKKKKKV